MISGFDYGTSNCALGIFKKNAVQLQILENDQTFLPSVVYSLHRDLISHHIATHLPESQQATFIQQRSNQINQAKRFIQHEGISPDEQTVFFGQAAFDEYLSSPEEGYFVKSPKSFLGVSGLQESTLNFFEDIVCAMMVNIKTQAEKNLQAPITHTVIGRPVNFQGIDSQAANQQALSILSNAASRAGFSSTEFLHEPLAAGFHFEQTLNQEKLVLVVDIGGGTTDCSMVKMSPERLNLTDRSADFLGHSGERIGGNDIDIHVAYQTLMPLFGLHSLKKNGQPLPTQIYWNAVSTNDLSAQSQFVAKETDQLLNRLLIDAKHPHFIQRMEKLRDQKQNHHLVRNAEKAKIALSSHDQTTVALDYIEEQLEKMIDPTMFTEAIKRPLHKMLNLMDEVILQAASQPDIVYITGGSAKSPVITQAIQQRLGNIPVVDGDHFGSVATGLTLWAEKIYA